jgi:hypothetical protein
MATLQEVTLAHSQRLSDLYRTRDVRLAEVQSLRDAQLRALPAAARLYQKYDDELSVAREKQIATEAKAEAARSAALLIAIGRRTDQLEDAQLARRSGDVDAVASKRRGEDAANRKYEAAIANLREIDVKVRARAAQDAERARIEALAGARRNHDEALAAAQLKYRGAVDAALVDERRDARDGERAYLDAITLGAAAARGAKTFADQALAEALARLPEAGEVLRTWRAELKTIAAETKQAETEAFSRFRHDLQNLKT